MAHSVCPWWIGYLLLNPFRRLAQDPREILAPYVSPGMTVLEPGPGMGFFTLELARLVGPAGRVVAVDVQPKMLDKLKRRASSNGLQDRIETRLVEKGSMALSDLKGKVDFALAFAMVHETPDPSPFFREVQEALKPGALVLLAEPQGHVKLPEFEQELKAAAGAGLAISDRPRIKRSHAVLLRKPSATDG